MDAGNDHNHRADNEKVKLVSVRPNVDAAYIARACLPDYAIDCWIPFEVHLSLTNSPYEIGRHGGSTR